VKLADPFLSLQTVQWASKNCNLGSTVSRTTKRSLLDLLVYAEREQED
jgi:hypothetical protein